MIALIVMSEESQHYVSQEDDDVTPFLNDKDAMMIEISNEEKYARRIIVILKLALKVTDARAELGEGQWWDRGPVCDIKVVFANLL